MDPVTQRVLDETKKFEAALPELLARYEGKWVVFRDGAVQSAHDGERAAYQAALDAFGPRGGFVVVKVKPIIPRPVTAGVLFSCR